LSHSTSPPSTLCLEIFSPPQQNIQFYCSESLLSEEKERRRGKEKKKEKKFYPPQNTRT
jgi:hypothetical protein